MATGKVEWLFFGCATLMILSALIFMPGSMSPLSPMPVQLVLAGWLFPPAAFLLTPVLYAASLLALWHRRRFGELLLVLTGLVAALNSWYFFASWDFGVRYQGATHTVIVAIENAVLFTLAGVLACFGIRLGSKTLNLLAHLLLFSALTWCAFPYLGEVP